MIDNMFQGDMKEQLQKAQAAQSEKERNAIIKKMAEDIAKLSNKKQNSVSVNNLDEVTAALRNELKRAISPVKNAVPKAVSSLESGLNDVNNNTFVKALEGLPTFVTSLLVKMLEYQSNSKDKDRMNLEHLTKEFMESIPAKIQESIQLQIEPTPIEVKASDVNVDLSSINFQPVIEAITGIKFPEQKEISFESVITALQPLEYLSDDAKSPLAVRLSDGQQFIKVLREMKSLLKSVGDGQRQMVTTMGGGNQITGIVKSRQSGYAIMGDGRTVVTTAGTAVPLSTNTSINKVFIMAEESNTGDIVIGSSTVVAATATRRGLLLVPSAGISIEADNLANVYIDSEQDGDGVTYVYYA